jgi:tRNA(Arg) A34 adenosine deaminase TadA
MNDHKKWMSWTIEAARTAVDKGQAPIAAIIVQNGQILACAHNTKTSERSGVAHSARQNAKH